MCASQKLRTLAVAAAEPLLPVPVDDADKEEAEEAEEIDPSAGGGASASYACSSRRHLRTTPAHARFDSAAPRAPRSGVTGCAVVASARCRWCLRAENESEKLRG